MSKFRIAGAIFTFYTYALDKSVATRYGTINTITWPFLTVYGLKALKTFNIIKLYKNLKL